MTATDMDPPVVLVVDDDKEVLETYELWLDREYDLRTAASGEEALDELDEAVDVVLLDRLMPGMSGDDVLDEIRSRNMECQVAMATAVEPDEDIADMPFDAYVTKALDRDSIMNTIDQLLTRSQYEDVAQEHYAIAEKLALLEDQKNDAELEASEEYQRLQRRFGELDEQVSDSASALSRTDLVSSLSRIEEKTVADDSERSAAGDSRQDQYMLLQGKDGDTRRIEKGTTLLVATPSPAGKEFITQSVRHGLDNGEGGLIITTDDSPASIVEMIEQTDTTSDYLRVVDCQSGSTGMDGDSTVVQDVDTPRNLTDIGIGFTNAFREFEDMDVERGRCGLLSLSVILSYVDQETVYRFCQTLSRGLQQEDFIGLFLLNRSAHDEQTENTLRRAVDGLVEVRSQEYGFEFRVVGLDGVCADWVRL